MVEKTTEVLWEEFCKSENLSSDTPVSEDLKKVILRLRQTISLQENKLLKCSQGLDQYKVYNHESLKKNLSLSAQVTDLKKKLDLSTEQNKTLINLSKSSSRKGVKIEE